ncbi:MAG: hemerythrin domain-containing protein [Patescibacteria group bacterium]
MTNNPIEIIKADHATVEELFQEYEGLGDGAVATKRTLVDQIIEELTLHAEMEETLCYPAFQEAFNKEDDKMVEEAYVEHQGAKNILEELKTLDPEQPEFDANVKVLMEQIRHHVEEEESELLPKAEKELPEEELAAMGDAMMEFKESGSEMMV